ncbi:hypothetical protein IC216_14445 [Clostridioides sp. ES-S-0145-01]|uniref:hypothetical protein n=1 Tax=Clostridioides sp. ES-S-0145-01 TaxID=2770784 RepID=UPI001D11E63A|nr:hypothetical protein [Clostridioides sp. ES-S-0145-01]
MFTHIGNTEKTFFREIFNFVLKYKKICMNLNLNIINDIFQLDEIIEYYSKKFSLNYMNHDKYSLEYLYICKTILKYFVKNNVVLGKDIDFVIEAEIHNHLRDYYDYDFDFYSLNYDLDYIVNLFESFEKFFNIKFYYESISYLAVEDINSSNESYKIFQSLISNLKYDIGDDATYDDFYSFYNTDSYIVAINTTFSGHIINLINRSFPVLYDDYNYCYLKDGYTYFIFNESGFESHSININSIILIILGYLEIYLNKSYESYFSL